MFELSSISRSSGMVSSGKPRADDRLRREGWEPSCGGLLALLRAVRDLMVMLTAALLSLPLFLEDGAGNDDDDADGGDGGGDDDTKTTSGLTVADYLNSISLLQKEKMKLCEQTAAF